ncbi:Eco57I restriction-modification methylase domain-containing protein [Pseudoduganella sp. R-34]|uniref:Eco57I restriction-modification methylase domain-containing protein n=1 Tax=Pseudoduganella sp. R-34 TaxID=3404062 RepID=UPI003CF8F2F7
MSQFESNFLFANDEVHAARIDAIDRLHAATALYTSEPVVDQLLARLRWPEGNGKLADTSAGDGQFLGKALQKLLAAGRSDQELLELLEGWEIHPHACAQARARLTEILVGAGRSRATASTLAARIVHNSDFLTQGPTSPRYDTIVGNPPFLRWTNVPEVLRDEYANHVPDYATGCLLHSFLDRCNRTLNAGGEMVLVSNDRWLFNTGAARLRAELGRRLGIQHVERLDPKSSFYRPKNRKAGTPPRITPIAVHLTDGGGRQLTSAAIYPDADLASYEGLPLLGDLAEVRLAPWLGPEGIFFFSMEEAHAKHLPLDSLVPVFDTDDTKDGIFRYPTRYAIRTDPKKEPCDAIMSHLKSRYGKMPAGARMSKLWMPPEAHWHWDLDQPSLFLSRIAQSPSPVRVPAGVLPMNHHLRIACRNRELLEKIARAMSGELAAKWFAAHGCPLEGGFWSMSAPLLRKMPLQLD